MVIATGSKEIVTHRQAAQRLNSAAENLLSGEPLAVVEGDSNNLLFLEKHVMSGNTSRITPHSRASHIILEQRVPASEGETATVPDVHYYVCPTEVFIHEHEQRGVEGVNVGPNNSQPRIYTPKLVEIDDINRLAGILEAACQTQESNQ